MSIAPVLVLAFTISLSVFLLNTKTSFLVPAGEDRWLCTLMLKQGWRVEYNAASDAYTNAPEDFKELYNQVGAAADDIL